MFEELPTRDRPAPRRRVLIIVAAVVVGLALVVAVIARVATATSHSADGPATVTVEPSVASTGPSIPVPGPNSLPVRHSPLVLPVKLRFLSGLTTAEIAAAHAECPRLAQTCTTTGEVPSDVRLALRARFPHSAKFVAVSDIAYASTSGPRLAYRRVSARVGDLRITVEVRQADSAAGSGGVSLITGGMASVRVQHVVGAYVVEAQLTSPHARAPDATALSGLIRDHRLLATG